jgi:hypothetical protein
MTLEQFQKLEAEARILMAETRDQNHDWGHVEMVLQNAELIKKELKAEAIIGLDEFLLKTAVLWHDISFSRYSMNFIQYFREAIRSMKIAKKYFQKAGLIKGEIKLLSDVIKRHPWSSFGILNKKRSIYHRIVQDADTIEIFSYKRYLQAIKTAERSLLWRMIIKIGKPLTYNWYLRHWNFIYNFPDVIQKLDEEKKIQIHRFN